MKRENLAVILRAYRRRHLSLRMIEAGIGEFKRSPRRFSKSTSQTMMVRILHDREAPITPAMLTRIWSSFFLAIHRCNLNFHRRAQTGESKDKRNCLPKVRQSGGKTSKTPPQADIIPGKQGNPITPSIIKKIRSLAKSICEEVERKDSS